MRTEFSLVVYLFVIFAGCMAIVLGAGAAVGLAYGDLASPFLILFAFAAGLGGIVGIASSIRQICRPTPLRIEISRSVGL